MTDLMTPNEFIELLKERRFCDIELMDVDDYDKHHNPMFLFKFDFDKKIQIYGRK